MPHALSIPLVTTVLTIALAGLVGCKSFSSVSRSDVAQAERELQEAEAGLEVVRRARREERDSAGAVVASLDPGDSRETLGADYLMREYEDSFIREDRRIRVDPSETTGRSSSRVAADVEKDLSARVERLKADKDDLEDLFGVKWGAGVGFLTGGSREIQQASVAGGTVSVDKSRRSWPVLLLETHVYPWQAKNKLMNFGVGPFVALGLSEDNLIDGVGGGLMLGGRSLTSTSNTSFNIGIGPYLVGEIQTLASGFAPGQAPPNGETAVRYSTEEDWKLLVMFSFAWSF